MQKSIKLEILKETLKYEKCRMSNMKRIVKNEGVKCKNLENMSQQN